MKIKYAFFTISYAFRVFIISSLLSFSILPAYGQIDNNFGKNTKGFRFSLGGGGAVLLTHYNDNPIGGLFVTNLDYDFNPYLSMGVEYQFGNLTGIDNHPFHHYYYIKSVDIYNAANFNIKASVGLFKDFHTNSAFIDALKRFYVGVGGGFLQTNITPTFDTSPNHADIYGPFYTKETITDVSFDFGTNINIPNFFGYDKIELNPNYQFNFLNSLYSDGFQSSARSSLKGFYNAFSLSIKYKF